MLLQSSLRNIVYFQQNPVIGSTKEPFRHFSNDSLKRCCICGETFGLNSSLLHDRDTCWERKENNCTDLGSWIHARGEELSGRAWISPLREMSRNNDTRWRKCTVECFAVMLYGVQSMIRNSDRASSYSAQRSYCCFWWKKFPKFCEELFFCFAVLWKCCVFWNDKDVCVCVCVSEEGLWAVWVGRASTHTYTHTLTHVHGIRGRAALTPASLWSVSPGLPARAALHRTTHADTMLTSDSPQLSERDKPGETPNCAAALPLASADASFKNGMNYF